MSVGIGTDSDTDIVHYEYMALAKKTSLFFATSYG